MKAMILASGEGKRLRPLTNKIPKPLLKIDTDTILDHQIKNLIECGIADIIITTGSFENKIKEHMKKYPNINVAYVNNPRYNTTNYIYSMWLTKNLIDDDVILLHGDLLFDKKLLKILVNEKCANYVLVNRRIKPHGKDFKAVIENDKVTKIGIEFFGKDAFACFPMYKFSEEDFLMWLNECGKHIEKREVNIYAENAFNDISDKIRVCPLYFSNEPCMEIDTREDLEMARKLLMGDKN